MDRILRAAVAAGLLGLISGTAASAHHSYASFDRKLVTLTGTVKEFQWTNPHTWIQVLVRGTDGRVTEWGVETAAPGMLTRGGWNSRIVKPGDKIVVQMHPRRDGSKSGSLVQLTLPDQKVLKVRDLLADDQPKGPGASAPSSPARP